MLLSLSKLDGEGYQGVFASDVLILDGSHCHPALLRMNRLRRQALLVTSLEITSRFEPRMISFSHSRAGGNPANVTGYCEKTGCPPARA
jgi:hypothetical protein